MSPNSPVTPDVNNVALLPMHSATPSGSSRVLFLFIYRTTVSVYFWVLARPVLSMRSFLSLFCLSATWVISRSCSMFVQLTKYSYHFVVRCLIHQLSSSFENMLLTEVLTQHYCSSTPWLLLDLDLIW